MFLIAIFCYFFINIHPVNAQVNVKSPGFNIEIIDQLEDLNRDSNPSFYLTTPQITKLKNDRIIDLSPSTESAKVSIDQIALDFPEIDFKTKSFTMLSSKKASSSLSISEIDNANALNPTICQQKQKCTNLIAQNWQKDEYGWGIREFSNLSKSEKYYSLNKNQKYSRLLYNNKPAAIEITINKDAKFSNDPSLNFLDLQLEFLP